VKKRSLIVIVVIIIIILSAIYFIYGKSNSKPVPSSKNSIQSSTSATSSSLSASDTDSESSVIGMAKALEYLPKPYMKFTYTNKTPDGFTETIKAVSGLIGKFSIVSVVELLPESEAMVVHFIEGSDGVYSFLDEEYNVKKSLWLTGNLDKGHQWQEEGVNYTIYDTGIVCDLDIGQFKDCIVLEADYDDGTAEYQYLAPGMGLIEVTDKKTGFVLNMLTAYSAAGIKEADDLFKLCAPYAINAIK